MQEERSLKDLMGAMLDNYKLSGKLNESNLASNWEEIVGRTIARNTQKLYLKNDVLYLHVDSPALKNEFGYLESTIIEKVNHFFGKKTINSIKVY